MTRHHPLLVALHSVMAVMVLVSLAAGGLVLAEMPRESPDRQMALAGQMSAGLAISVLLIVRLLTRIRKQGAFRHHGEVCPPSSKRSSTWLGRPSLPIRP